MMSLQQSKELTLFSPAKANLFLKVLFKRKDGYHEIASLFQTLNFGDNLNLSLSTTKKDEFTIEGLLLPADLSNNLIGKALDLFREKTKKNSFVKIHLLKRIPLQSGLGGGSSNAATTLFGLNCLLGKPLKQIELLELAEQIGSDVPFFFSSGTAFCTGRGEKFQDLKIPKKSFYLAFPNFGLSTKEVFSAFKIESLANLQNAKAQLEPLVIFNDLEKAAFTVQPKLKDFKKQLLELGFETVSMTGSGSTFLCFGEPKQKLKMSNQSPDLGVDNAFSAFCLVEMLQRNSLSWYPMCVWKKNSLLSPVLPVLSGQL